MGEKSGKVMIEGRGGIAGNDTTAPSDILDQAPGACARRIRGGKGQKSGGGLRRRQVRENPAREQTVRYTGPPPLQGGVVRTGGKAVADIGIKARRIESGGQEGGKKGFGSEVMAGFESKGNMELINGVGSEGRKGVESKGVESEGQ